MCGWVDFLTSKSSNLETLFLGTVGGWLFLCGSVGCWVRNLPGWRCLVILLILLCLMATIRYVDGWHFLACTYGASLHNHATGLGADLVALTIAFICIYCIVLLAGFED